MLALFIFTGILTPDILGHAESGPGLGPAGIKGRVGENFCDFLPGDAVLSGGSQMVLEGAVHQSLGHECHHRHQGPVPKGELILPAPDLPKQYIVIELRKFRGKFPQGVPPRCLLDCHIDTSCIEKVLETTLSKGKRVIPVLCGERRLYRMAAPMA